MRHLYKAVVDGDVAMLQGLDGRKMSKSYGNTIPLFGTPKQLQKAINKSRRIYWASEQKIRYVCGVSIWCAFANEAERQEMRAARVGSPG